MSSSSPSSLSSTVPDAKPPSRHNNHVFTQRSRFPIAFQTWAQVFDPQKKQQFIQEIMTPCSRRRNLKEVNEFIEKVFKTLVPFSLILKDEIPPQRQSDPMTDFACTLSFTLFLKRKSLLSFHPNPKNTLSRKIYHFDFSLIPIIFLGP